MSSIVKTVWGFVTGSREWLVVITLAVAAAWFYAKFETVRADRDRLFAWAEMTCAATGEGFIVPSPEPGTQPLGDAVRVAKPPRGARCQARVAGLAAFERHAAIESARALAEAAAADETRTQRDTAFARAAAEAARASNDRMEKTNAQVQGDRTGSAWFDALNDLAGLRAPGS